MFALRLLKVLLLCHPLVGVVVDVLMAYSTVWLPGLVGIVTMFTVILFCVGVPLTVGAPLTAAPSPIATALAVTVPVGVIAHIEPVTLVAEILVGSVIVLVLALYVVGVPVMGTVTTVLFVLVAVPAVNPGGRLLTAKCDAVIVDTNSQLVVNTMLAPLTV